MHIGAISKILPLLVRVIIGFLLIWFLILLSYFAWRAGQPMDLSQFKGLTYYQFLDWRSIAYHDLAVKYHTAHPGQIVKFGMCEGVERLVELTVMLPQAGWYTYMSMTLSPNDLARFKAMQHNYAPDGVTWLNFLPKWWDTYEKFLWSAAAYQPQTSVAYCRIHPNIPTPTELKAMKLEYAQDSTVSTAHTP